MASSKPTVRSRFDNQLRMEVVTTHDQWLHAMAIRAICFMEEHGVAAHQTFDGNDYQSTHVICYAGDDPVGTARIRWFCDFVKFERTSVRAKYRTAEVVKACAEFMLAHVARKGYQRVITHAKPKYARLWRMLLGFEIRDKPPLYFNGHDEPYLELVKNLAPAHDALSEDSETSILFRTEGYWDVVSAYEAAVEM